MKKKFGKAGQQCGKAQKASGKGEKKGRGRYGTSERARVGALVLGAEKSAGADNDQGQFDLCSTHLMLFSH